MRIFSLNSFYSVMLGLACSLTFNASVADHHASIKVFSEHEKELHQQRMKNMTEEERINYRNEQYQILRQRASAIGYSMPETPPWAGAEKALVEASAETRLDDNTHGKQLNAYRQEAADKRKAMHERIEKQREEIKKRIADLVEKNAVKPTTQATPNMYQQPMPPMVPMTPMPPMPMYQGYYPPMPYYRY